jgi:hypothetical protein
MKSLLWSVSPRSGCGAGARRGTELAGVLHFRSLHRRSSLWLFQTRQPDWSDLSPERRLIRLRPRCVGCTARPLELLELLCGGELSNRRTEGASYGEHESKAPCVFPGRHDEQSLYGNEPYEQVEDQRCHHKGAQRQAESAHEAGNSFQPEIRRGHNDQSGVRKEHHRTSTGVPHGRYEPCSAQEPKRKGESQRAVSCASNHFHLP